MTIGAKVVTVGFGHGSSDRSTGLGTTSSLCPNRLGGCYKFTPPLALLHQYLLLKDYSSVQSNEFYSIQMIAYIKARLFKLFGFQQKKLVAYLINNSNKFNK